MFRLEPLVPLAKNVVGNSVNTNGYYKFTPSQDCLVHGIVFEPNSVSNGDIAAAVMENYFRLVFAVYPTSQYLENGTDIRNILTIPTASTGNRTRLDLDFSLQLYGEDVLETYAQHSISIRETPMRVGETYILFPNIDAVQAYELKMNPDSVVIGAFKNVYLVVEYPELRPTSMVKLARKPMSLALDGNTYNSGTGVTSCYELSTPGKVAGIEVRVSPTYAGAGFGVPALLMRNYATGASYQAHSNSGAVSGGIPRGVQLFSTQMSVEDGAANTVAALPSHGIVWSIDTHIFNIVDNALYTNNPDGNHSRFVRQTISVPLVNTYAQRWYAGHHADASGTYVAFTEAQLDALGLEVWALMFE